MCDVGLVKVDNDDYALYQSRFVLLRLKVSPKSLQASTENPFIGAIGCGIQQLLYQLTACL